MINPIFYQNHQNFIRLIILFYRVIHIFWQWVDRLLDHHMSFFTLTLIRIHDYLLSYISFVLSKLALLSGNSIIQWSDAGQVLHINQFRGYSTMAHNCEIEPMDRAYESGSMTSK